MEVAYAMNAVLSSLRHWQDGGGVCCEREWCHHLRWQVEIGQASVVRMVFSLASVVAMGEVVEKLDFQTEVISEGLEAVATSAYIIH